MHDPMTQAFVIPFPWYTTGMLGKTKWRYWHPFITIWHVDPERGGSDDSCGWFTPPFCETTREIVKQLAGDEARHPWFAALDAKQNDDPVLCERLVHGAIMLMSRCLRNRGVIWREVSQRDATRWASIMTHNSIDNFRSALCFKSGYHSNWYKDGIPNTPEQDEWHREENARGFFGAIAGLILRDRRWWFQKPKYHVWHWQLQIHPLQAFKRWAFSRCSKCGKRFAWGASVGTNSWSGTGPSWSGERDVFHMDCDRPQHDGACSAKVGA